MNKFLKEKFEELAKGQELIPVVLDRASWEALRYTIDLALKLKYKKEEKNG